MSRATRKNTSALSPSNSALASSTPMADETASGVGSFPVARRLARVSSWRNAFDMSSRHSRCPFTDTTAYDRPSVPRITRSTPAKRIKASPGGSSTTSAGELPEAKAGACKVSPSSECAAPSESLAVPIFKWKDTGWISMRLNSSINDLGVSAYT